MTRDEIFNVVKAHMVEIIEDFDESIVVEESNSMLDLGADSIDVALIATDSMQQLQIKVDRIALGQATNLAALLDLFETAYQTKMQVDGQ